MSSTSKLLLSLALLTPTLSSANEKPVVAIYDLEGTISESGQTQTSLLNLNLNSDRPLTFFDLTRSLAKASSDPKVKAIVIDIDDASLNLNQLQEIRRLLKDSRKAGKDVWLYTDTYSNATAYLGSSANHFTLMPEGDVSFSGIHSENFYFKGLLDKVGVAADVIHIGDFKSYGETFYRNGPSEPALLQEEALIDGIFQQITTTVSQDRNIPTEKVRELIDLGTFTPQQAKEAGLVDDLKHRTDFSAAVKAAYPDHQLSHEYELPDLDGPEIKGLMDLFKLALKQPDKSRDKQDFVAVVSFEGGITSESIAPVRNEILKLVNNSKAKALVFRVDSPGGSALASEVLWEATDEWKASGRPLIVSMGSVAASGGYYISSSADQIFAEEGTITGSIGVVGMKWVMTDAMNTLGLTTHTIQRGKNAGAYSMTRRFNEAESQVIRHSMEQVYGTFKNRVQQGRGDRLKGELESLAGGRVYTGTKALEIGLVDQIGGLQDAIAAAAKAANLTPDHARLIPEPKSPLEGMFQKQEKTNDGDEVVRMGTHPTSPIHTAIHDLQTSALIPALPPQAQKALNGLLRQVEACSDSPIQLIGPSLPLNLNLR